MGASTIYVWISSVSIQIEIVMQISYFADWVEFSPYEIGMAKYGTFMSPDLFGSKFFMGTVVKKYSENPLHFLMGKYVMEGNLKLILILY